MAIEIEAKMFVTDHEPTRARLRELGARSEGACLETNTFFDSEDRSLLAADQGLRLRRQHSDDANDGSGDQFTITYKGPRRHGPLKSRDEVELRVANDRDAITLLAKLGYLRVLSFEKRRESWKLNDCMIELDELPHVGKYIEIEGPSEAAIMKARETLRLNDHPLVKASYVALLMTHLQDNSTANRTVTFDSEAKEN